MRYDHLSEDDRRSLLILVMEDLRGAFFPVNPRTQAVIDLADSLGYEHVMEHAEAHLADEGYQDGRHFRVPWSSGGYEGPPFSVTRRRSDASEALISAVDSLCEYPESRLTDNED